MLLIGFFFMAACSSPEEKFAEKMMQANANLEEGNVDKAIKFFTDLQSEQPKHPAIIEGLAIAYSKKKDFITSAFYFSQLADNYPNSPEYLLYSADAFLKGEDSASAIEKYEMYLLVRDEDWQTWRTLGNLYLENGQTANAIHAYQKSHSIKPQPELALRAAALANTTGNLRQAEEAFASLLQSEDPRISEKAHLGYLEIKYKRRQWAEVDSMIEETERRFPGAIDRSPLVDVKKALAQYEEKQKEKSIQTREEEERQQRLLDELNERKRKLELARKRAEERRLASQQAENQSSQTSSNTSEASDETTSTAQTTTPDDNTTGDDATVTTPERDPIVIHEIPELVEQETAASTPFQEAMKAGLEFRANDPSAALNKFWEAINYGDTTGKAFYELSRTYKLMSQFTEAEVAAMEAMRRDKRNKQYISLYLDIIEKTQSPSKQVREINRFRTLLPNDPDLVLRLARVYSKPGGDRSAARGFYQLFLRLAPQHPEASEARRALRQ